jgi:dimethylargininase
MDVALAQAQHATYRQTAAYLGHNTLLAIEAYADHPAFADLDVLRVPPEEAYAADALAIGNHVIVPDGYPRVAAMLRVRGFAVLPVLLSEFAKADGGVTCLSLVWSDR